MALDVTFSSATSHQVYNGFNQRDRSSLRIVCFLRYSYSYVDSEYLPLAATATNRRQQQQQQQLITRLLAYLVIASWECAVCCGDKSAFRRYVVFAFELVFTL